MSILDPNLVLYLPFYKKDAASFMSDDAFGHLVTVTGAAWGIQGRTFDGVDDVIVVPEVASLKILNPFSFAIWLSGYAPAGDAEQDLANKNREYIVRLTNTGVIQFLYHNGTSWQTLSSATSIAQNSWTHVRITRETNGANSDCKIYLNGVLDNSATQTGTPVNIAQDLYIGSYNGVSERYNGTIGEMALWSRVAGERHYQSTKWRFQ